MIQRENLLNVLMYVFENYYDQDQKVDSALSEAITDEMLREGFLRKDIDKALAWFEDLDRANAAFSSDYHTVNSNSFRILTADEQEKLSEEAIAYLYWLEQKNILDPVSREMLLDRIMELGEFVIEAAEIKWVTLMVLYSQPTKKDHLLLMEDVIFSEQEDTVSH